MGEVYNSGQELVLKKYHQDTLDHHLSLTEAESLVQAAEIEELSPNYQSEFYKDVARKIYSHELPAEKGVLEFFTNKIKELSSPLQPANGTNVEGPQKPGPKPKKARPPRQKDPRLASWSHLQPGHQKEFAKQFTMAPVSLIASFNFMVGKTKFPAFELGENSLSLGANAGVKLFNSARIFFNFDDTKVSTITPSPNFAFARMNFRLKHYRVGIGFNIPVHTAWLQPKFDIMLGKGIMDIGQNTNFLRVDKLFSFAASPQVCTLWDSLCLGYQFSLDAMSQDIHVSDAFKTIDQSKGDRIVRQHNFTLNANLGWVFDWFWWKKSRNK